jgi:selenide,water dikinase
MEYVSMGLVPEGTSRNREFRLPFVLDAGSIDPFLLDLLFDPQTSGGLLAAVSPEDAPRIVEGMREAGLPAAVIGRVERTDEKIRIQGALQNPQEVV